MSQCSSKATSRRSSRSSRRRRRSGTRRPPRPHGASARRSPRPRPSTRPPPPRGRLGGAALEITGQIEPGRVEVRLAGRDPELVVIADETPDTSQVGFGEEASGRITLRLPESLKAGIEAAADREGISTNAWLVRTIARTLEQRPARKSRNRMQGYAQG